MKPKIILPLLALCYTLSAQVTTIENGASYRTAIAAGSWAQLKGTFAGVTQTIGSIPVGTTLGGVTVTVAGTAAPVYFVSTSQINFIVPAAATPGLHPIQVRTGGGTYDSTIRVISSAPGLFQHDQATPPKGAVLNQNSSVNTSTNPAVRNDFVQIYASGPGAFQAAVVDGGAAPSNPLTRTVSTPQVFIGGVQAEVQYSGLAPGLPAVWQINARVPNLSFITGRVPVVVFMDGVDSNEVAIFVQ
jgi:uncharacterized protein (TIGR03437 family)